MNMKIVGFFGFKGAGKDSGSQPFLEAGYKKMAFADSIKDMLSAIFVWDRDLLEGNTNESRVWRETVDTWWAEKLNIPKFTPRRAMTYLGTDVMRKHVHDDLWLNSLHRKMLNRGGDRIVLTDLRHRHEINFAAKVCDSPLLFHVVKGEFPAYWPVTSSPDTQYSLDVKRDYMKEYYPDVHVSEWEWNYFANSSAIRIDNNGTIGDLYNRVTDVAKVRKWI